MDEKIAPYQALRRSKQDEIARRVQIHQSKISRASARMKAAKQAVPAPLAMLAHGDSWFDYPLSGNTPILGTTDIVEHLQNMGKPKPVYSKSVAMGRRYNDRDVVAQAAGSHHTATKCVELVQRKARCDLNFWWRQRCGWKSILHLS